MLSKYYENTFEDWQEEIEKQQKEKEQQNAD